MSVHPSPPSAQRQSVAFSPILPEKFNRYSHCKPLYGALQVSRVRPFLTLIVFSSRTLGEYQIPPLMRSFAHPVLDWIAHRHPEGAMYFVHKTKRIMTDAYLYDVQVLAQISDCIQDLQTYHGLQDHFDSGSDVDIVLDLGEWQPPSQLTCRYYCVDHAARLIFWFHTFDMNQLSIWQKVPGINSDTHVKCALEIEYWRHRDLFPSSAALTRHETCELRDTIRFNIADAMTSPTTIVPYTVEYLSKMLALTETIMDRGGTGTGGHSSDDVEAEMDDGSVCVIARFQRIFARERFFHFHGETSARLDKKNLVYGRDEKPSYFIVVLSAFLFGAPLDQLQTLHNIYRDGIISYYGWTRFIAKLRPELQERILYATIFLNANMGFLAVLPSDSSYARMASYISILFDLGSVIIGLILLRNYPLDTQDTGSSSEGAAFFRRHRDSLFGLEALAIIYALPHAWMLWGICAFCAAFILIVVDTSPHSSKLIMIAISITLGTSIIGCIWTEQHHRWTAKLKRIGGWIRLVHTQILRWLLQSWESLQNWRQNIQRRPPCFEF
ncbi:hypothetical protein DFH06DRAFT_1179598 [Mycena polygramma]|nr:hypothetical protein DFH06DRAFT_1179598 [Mycena polygramma]